MTSPNANGAGSAQSAGNNNRPRPNRVVPAIPLSLSRPKPARPQPKNESNAQAGAAPVNAQEEVKANGVNGVQNKRDQEAAVNASQPDPQSAEVKAEQEDGTKAHDANKQSLSTPKSLGGGGGGGGGSRSLFTGLTPDQTPIANKENDETPKSFNSGSASMSISSGSTPDGAPERVDQSVNSQAEPLSAAAAATSPPARKPTERFDMRQIRTELPPAFVPSGDRQTPLSATSNRGPAPIVLPFAHQSHPSAGSIVFGGHDSSTSSPAPPLSANSIYPIPQSANLQLVPPFHPQSWAEVSTQRLYQPAYPTGPARADQGQGPPSAAQLYHQQHGSMAHRYSVATSRDGYQNGHVANGHGLNSRQGSQHSSVAHDAIRSDGDLQSPVVNDHPSDNGHVAPRDGRYPQPRHQQNPSMPFQGNHPSPEFAAEMDNMELLRAHVFSHFRNPSLADCHLQISQDWGAGRSYVDAHKLILARSPTLLDMINASEPPAAASLATQVHVALKGNYLRLGPFMATLGFLYGGPLPVPTCNSLVPEERMHLALQHIAIGVWLRVAAVADRGMAATLGLLDWHTILAALTFGLQGGIGPSWPLDDTNEEKASPCTSEDSFKPETGNSPTYGPYASTLLRRVADFLVHYFPPDFYLDSSAAELDHLPRVPAASPTIQESTPSRPDPRLSTIQFGEAPIAAHRPNQHLTFVSRVLLSLPFPILKFILEHPFLPTRIGAETVASVMRQVINEREVRRQKALKAHLADPDAATAEGTAVQNLFWEELVEPWNQYRAGFRLTRRHRGVDTPPSSGNESERVN